MTKILLWDLETTNLNADFGFILCGGVKELGKKEKIYSLPEFKRFRTNSVDDKPLVKKLAEVLSEADVWVTWYGTFFDVPYLNSRLIQHGLDPMPPIPHVDGWKIARNRLKLHSNRLASVSAFLSLQEKTPILQEHWLKAAAGYHDSIKYVTDHCRQDVIVLEEVYERIKPLALQHPNVAIGPTGGTGGCPICGNLNTLVKRGFTMARTSKKQRYQCRKCGGWSTGRPERIENIEVR